MFKCTQCSSASAAVLQFLSAQAVFKDSREVLLKMGAMRFVESLVTARPMPPARGLQVTNDQHSFAFKFGVGDESSSSSASSKKGNSIVPLTLSAFDSRAADGQLCMFQSTPAGERLRSLLRKHQTHHRNKHIAATNTSPQQTHTNTSHHSFLNDPQVTLQVNCPFSSCCSSRKRSHERRPVLSAYASALLCAITTTTCRCAAVCIAQYTLSS